MLEYFADDFFFQKKYWKSYHFASYMLVHILEI